MVVIFVNRFFHPDISATSQLLSDLAFSLAAGGRTVRVVTSRSRYEDARGGDAPLPAREHINGVEVHRVWTSRFGRARLAGRAADYLTFYASAAWTLFRLARRGDVVVVKTDPPLMSIVAAPICRARGASLVNWLQDLFPEVAQAFGIGRRRLGFAALSWLRTVSLKRAAANVTIGRRMAEHVEALGVGRTLIRIVPNWADGDAIKPVPRYENPFRQEIGLGHAFVVGYSGNLGRVHEIATILDAMEIVSADITTGRGGRETQWLFIGGGALTPTLQSEIARRGIRNVTFLPYQPRSALARSLSVPDAHLGSLRPEFEGLVVPSKVSGAAAAGRPILFVGEPTGEIGTLITRYQCGYAIPPGDGAGLARAIAELADDPARCDATGRRARQAFEAEFSRDAALARWSGLLDEIGQRNAPRA